MDLKQIAEWTGIITGIAGAALVLWRYFVNPLRKVLTSVKEYSEAIAHGLPILQELLLRWPDLHGQQSFLHYIDSINQSCAAANARSIALLNLENIPIYECDIEGNCVFANIYCCEEFGLPHGEMKGFGWTLAIVAEDRDRVIETWCKSVKHKTPYECTYTIHNKRTNTKKVKTTKALPLQQAGVLFGYIGIFENDKT